MPVNSLDFQGMPALELQAADGARALVMLHGGHLVSWLPAGGHGEMLYLSPRSEFAQGRAIRGGVPVVFPQFSDRGPLTRHGFARTSTWRVRRTEPDDGGAAQAVLCLEDDRHSRALWPHAFALDLRVRVQGDSLSMELTCSNPGDSAFSFACALHTYLRVEGLAQVGLEGLGGQSFFDAVNGVDQVQQDTLLRIAGEVDRVYGAAQSTLRLHDTSARSARTREIRQTGFADVVVWNPGPQRCAALADMPADGYRDMVCLEAARIHRPVQLAPGQSWTGNQTLRVLQ